VAIRSCHVAFPRLHSTCVASYGSPANWCSCAVVFMKIILQKATKSVAVGSAQWHQLCEHQLAASAYWKDLSSWQPWMVFSRRAAKL
jgi:hypothetical protein